MEPAEAQTEDVPAQRGAVKQGQFWSCIGPPLFEKHTCTARQILLLQ